MKPENIFLYVIVAFVIVMTVVFVFWTPLEDALTYLNLNKAPTQASTTLASADDVKRAATAYTQTRARAGSEYITLVSYDGTNFYPPIVTIKRGESVRFVNKSNLTMRIVSNTFNGVPIYRGFSQADSVGKGGTYELSIPEPGIWGYHNLNSNPGIIGIIHVEP